MSWSVELAKKAPLDLWIKRFKRHFNGTCICYVKDEAGRTKGSGKDCEFSKLNGQQQNYIREQASK